ncbi:MAG: hypothetical protein ACJ780_19320 [Solirubrobacteraceae bacterium]
MAASVYPVGTTVSGTVAAVNPKGVKLSPQDEWFNVSKYATDVTLPERGESVTLTLDKAGFVRSCLPADGAVIAPSARAATLAQGAPSPAPTCKDRTITRLAVLKAAAEYSASKPESKSGDVLKIAESWERWVLRSDAPEEDNVDAF